ncbi:MAG: SpoIIE family protein phosphatase [Candidatus Ozemobacteraceae bacterium]
MSFSASRTGGSTGFGILALFFVGIPLFVLSVAGQQAVERFAEIQLRDRIVGEDVQLDSVVAATTRSMYVLRSLRSFLRLAKREGIESPRLEHLRRTISRKRGYTFAAYFFQNHRLAKVFPANAGRQKMMSDLFASLFLDGDAFSLAQRQLKNALLALFGPGNRPELIRRDPGKLVLYTTRDGKGAYYWAEDRSGLGVFILVPRIPEFIKRVKKQYGTTHPVIGAAVPRLNQWLPPAGVSRIDMQLAFTRTKVEGCGRVVSKDREWFFVQNLDGEVLCRLVPESRSAESAPADRAVKLGFGCAFLALLLVVLARFEISIGLAVTERLEGCSIRTRLAILFSTASIVPLGLGALLGGLALQDRREILRTETSRQALERIHHLEQAHIPRLERFRKLCRMLRDADWVKTIDRAVLERRISAYKNADLLQRFELRNERGEILFTTDDPEVHGAAQATALFSKVAIKRRAENRLSGGGGLPTAEELVGESILSSDELGMATLLRERSRVWRFRMGTGDALWFWDVYPDLATGPSFIGVIHQLEWLFDSEIRTRLARRPIAHDQSFQAAYYVNPKLTGLNFWPRLHGQGARAVRAAGLRSYATGQVVTREIQLDGETFWVTMKPEGTVFNYILMDLTPAAGPLKALGPIRQRLGAGVILAVLISFLAAQSIALLFLQPIRDLESGINAIQARDSDVRIPLRRTDEFGALAGAFNRVLGELRELQYGRVVQESLMPSLPTAPEGYRIAFLRRPAADLAGDYHDVVPLEDGSWAIILGDVTGHGLSAALAMAMAKATVAYRPLAGWNLPSQVMERLNALFYRELKPRHKFMTMACVRLDPVSHRLTYENAGHPFLTLYSYATGRVSELAIPSMPLGAKSTRKPVFKETTLQPGDAFLLYSDGFVESPNAAGELFGYIRFPPFFQECMQNWHEPEAVLAAMNRRFDTWRVPGPLIDDVTLLLVQRLPPKKESTS